MPPAVPNTFAIECACGAWSRGDRQPKSQVLTCAGCGKPAFVLPAAESVFGPALPIRRNWSGLGTVWLLPAVSGVLALAVVAIIISAIVRGQRPTGTRVAAAVASPAETAGLLEQRFTAARLALEGGAFRVARDELDAALDLAARNPDALHSDRAARIARWRRQADLLADLLSESVTDIARHAARRSEREWENTFRERYAGRAVLLDSQVVRDASGHVQVDYYLEAAGGVGTWKLDDLEILAPHPLRQPQRLIVGFRLQAVRWLGRDRWLVVADPTSGVLITDREVMAGLSLGTDESTLEVLRRQTQWDPGG